MPYSCIKIIKVKITGYLHYIQKGLALAWIVLFLSALPIVLFSSLKHYVASNTYYREGKSWTLMKLVFLDIIMCMSTSLHSKQKAKSIGPSWSCYIPRHATLKQIFIGNDILFCFGVFLYQVWVFFPCTKGSYFALYTT